MGEWKAVRYGIDSATELYNLNDDSSETNNLADDHPEITEKMNELFEFRRSEAVAFPYGGVVQDHRSQDRY